jgi:hypothetical protein
MKPNVGSFDAAARTVGGILVILVGHLYRDWWALLGVVPILTALLAFCPAYCLFHFNTSAQDEDEPRGGSHSRV